MPISTHARLLLAVSLAATLALIGVPGAPVGAAIPTQDAGGGDAGREPPPADGNADDPDKKDGPADGRLFPGIDLDLENHRMVIEGEICLQAGLLELVACTRYGKTHESICSLAVDPKNFKAALLLLGLEEKPQVEYLGERKELKGDRVTIWLEWKEGEKTVRHLAEKLILNRRTNETMRPVGWVFTGSRFIKQPVFVEGKEEPVEKEFFMASETGSLVTTYHDPDSILDNPLEEGGDDTVWYANDKLLPERGTPVRFIVEVRTPGKKKPEAGKGETPAGEKEPSGEAPEKKVGE